MNPVHQMILHEIVHHHHTLGKFQYAWRVFHIRRSHFQRTCLRLLWNRESGWNPWAVNKYSGAYGIPQALGHGHPYPLGRFRPQIRWGRAYIQSVYRTACGAWRHSLEWGWY